MEGAGAVGYDKDREVIGGQCLFTKGAVLKK